MSSIMWNDPLLAKYNFQPQQETQITNLITAVDALMDRYTGRMLAQGTYDRKLKVLTTGDVHLTAYPVQQINRVLSDRDSALSVTSTAVEWSVSTSWANGGVYLTWFNSGTWSNETLTYAEYPTVSQMATAISGVSTFTCTVQGYGPYPSSDLISGININGQAGTTSNNTLMIWKQTNSMFEVLEDAGILRLGEQPLGNPGGFMATGGGYGFSGFGGRRHNHRGYVRVVWQGGFDPYPEDLCYCAAELVGWIYNGKNNALTSESYGADYSYVLRIDPKRIPITSKQILDSYKDRSA